MSQPITVEEPIDEGTPGWNVGQAEFSNNVLIKQADVNGNITLDVYERGNPTAIFTDAAITPVAGNADGSDVIIDNPVNDGRWGIDEDGYNFSHYFNPATAGVDLEGGKLYSFVYQIPAGAGAADPSAIIVVRWYWRIISNRSL